jgi:2'-5' RNA ligase
VRLFFALWPDAVARSELAAAGAATRADRPGRMVRAADLHMTLAFLGEIAPGRLPELIAIGTTLPWEPTTLRIDRAGFFPRGGILWLGPALTPPALLAAVGELHAQLRAIGLRIEDRPFAAHVTVARKAGVCRSGPLEVPVLWRADTFALCTSAARPPPAAGAAAPRRAPGSAYHVVWERDAPANTALPGATRVV